MKVILFVITYGIMEFQFQKNGKMNNIRILKEMNIKKEQKHSVMLGVEEYQIKKIITILIYKIKMEEL